MALTPAVTDPNYKSTPQKSGNEGNAGRVPEHLEDKTYSELLAIANKRRAEDNQLPKNTSKAKLIEILSAEGTHWT